MRENSRTTNDTKWHEGFRFHLILRDLCGYRFCKLSHYAYVAGSVRQDLSLLASDAIHFFFQCQAIERRMWKSQKKPDALVENEKHFAEGAFDLGVVSVNGRGVGPGHSGQVSLAALSQTVNTKSILGAPGRVNSSQLLLRRPLAGIPARASSLSASGRTVPEGCLPALKAVKAGLPLKLRMASAMIERAEFPVHRNSTL
jgi:hypothetical protein